MKTIQDIKDLEKTNIETYSARNIVLIPPFLLETVESTMRVSTVDSKAVLVEIVREIHRFDEHPDRLRFPVEKANDSCANLL